MYIYIGKKERKKERLRTNLKRSLTFTMRNHFRGVWVCVSLPLSLSPVGVTRVTCDLVLVFFGFPSNLTPAKCRPTP